MIKNMDKENVYSKSKISQPLAPLPALPYALGKKARVPLKTLAGSPNNNVINISTPLVPGSLKRHQSRELPGTTSLGNKEVGDESPKRRRLTSHSVEERIQLPDLLRKSYMTGLNKKYLSGIMSYLLSAETKLVAKPRVKSETRADIINWLMKINGVDGNPATIQTAVWYLDTLLATSNVEPENLHLIAAAAFWIADKVQDRVSPASYLLEQTNHAFTLKQLLEAEREVLVKLKFPRQPVVPQDYLGYYALWCKKKRPLVIEMATTFICLCGMMVDKKLCNEYPSIIAAASIRTALLLLREKELIPRLQSCPTYLTAEKKAAGNLPRTSEILEKAVRKVDRKRHSFTTIFEQYGLPPKCIAETIASAANDYAVMRL